MIDEYSELNFLLVENIKKNFVNFFFIFLFLLCFRINWKLLKISFVDLGWIILLRVIFLGGYYKLYILYICGMYLYVFYFSEVSLFFYFVN